MLTHLVLLLLVEADGAADTAQIAARVVFESPGDGGRSDWVDLRVDGGGIASIERCERLVEAELKHLPPAGVTWKPRVARACSAAALPPAPHPAIEAQILRLAEPLPTLDLFALSAPPTTGRLVRYERELSAVECERKKERMVAQAHGAAAQEQAKHVLDEELRLNAEQIRKACEKPPAPVKLPPLARGRHRPPKWLTRDETQSRCEQAKQMGTVLARKKGDAAAVVDPVERSCVRDGSL